VNCLEALALVAGNQQPSFIHLYIEGSETIPYGSSPEFRVEAPCILSTLEGR